MFFLKNVLAQDDIHTKILENKSNLHCPTGFVLDRIHYNQIEDLSENLDFSPRCIWKTIRKNAEKYAKGITQGFAFGVEIDASYSAISAGLGTELVMFKLDDDKLLLGMTRIKHIDASLSLSGISLTQSVVLGSCPEQLQSYVGWFRYFGAIAMLRNSGITLPITGITTGCNTITSVRGMSSPIIIAGYSLYEQLGNPIIVTGPRVKPLLNFMKGLNTIKANYKNAKKSNRVNFSVPPGISIPELIEGTEK